MSKELENELAKLPMWMRKRYVHMDAAQRASFDTQFQRHIRMCRKNGIHADPAWVREVLQDMGQGFSTIGAEIL